ncbi:unnamed protein product [Pylaiella littoralis]
MAFDVRCKTSLSSNIHHNTPIRLPSMRALDWQMPPV